MTPIDRVPTFESKPATTEALLDQKAKDWGDPVVTHTRIGLAWSGILDVEVSPHQVALMMAAMKLVRASINPDEPDSLDDAAGYVEIGKRIMRDEVTVLVPIEYERAMRQAYGSVG